MIYHICTHIYTEVWIFRENKLVFFELSIACLPGPYLASSQPDDQAPSCTMTLRIRVKKPNGDSSHLERIWSWSNSFLRSWRIFDTGANKWFPLHGTSRHLQQTSPIRNTPTYHSRRSTPEFYKCRGWCQFGSCLGKRRIPLDDLITICRLAILQPHWCSTWHLDQDNTYLTEKEKQHTQQCCCFFLPTIITLLSPANPTNSALGSQIKFFSYLKSMVIIKFIKSTKTPSIQPFQPSHPSHFQDPSVRVATDAPRIGSSHPESPPVKWSAWIEPLNLGRNEKTWPTWGRNTLQHGDQPPKFYTLAMENCHAINISKPSINGPLSMAMNWIGWVEWDSPFSEPNTFGSKQQLRNICFCYRKAAIWVCLKIVYP